MAMKKYFLILSALTGALLCGCVKENGFDPMQEVKLTTTICFDGDSRTKALTEAGVKTFAVGDRVAVIYKNGINQTSKAVSEPLTDGDIFNEGKGANITVSMLYPMAGTIRFVYPATFANDNIPTPDVTEVTSEDALDLSPLATQDGTLSSLAGNLDFCYGDGTLTKDGNNYTLPNGVTLINQLTIGKFSINSSISNVDITSKVNTITLQNGSDSYTVNVTDSPSTIWVAMKPISTGDITINVDGKEKTVSGQTLAAGTIYPITLSVPIYVRNLVLYCIPHIFAGKFYFAQSNFRFNSSGEYEFYEKQWDYDQNPEYNYCLATVTLDEQSFDWNGVTVKTGLHFKLLSVADWNDILYNRQTSSGLRFAKGRVCGVEGLILLPDDWQRSYYTTLECNLYDYDFWFNNITEDDWTRHLEVNGAVFLPCTYNDDSLGIVGKYITSDLSDFSENICCCVQIYNDYIEFGLGPLPVTGIKDRLYSVRAVMTSSTYNDLISQL